MTVIGLDDTDSRERGMCTTYAAATLAERLPAVSRTLLIRLNPAVEYKTRGNAALAIHTEASPSEVRPAVEDVLAMAETDDPRTNPGAVIADIDPDVDSDVDSDAIPQAVADFADDALHEVLPIDAARDCITAHDFDAITAGDGRGVVGALAAVGAWASHDDWTYECIAYRKASAWGTERAVDDDSVFAAAADAYPAAWDTADGEEGYAVCVPKTPCPILHGIRGDDATTVERVSRAIESEPVARRHTFLTNQGTDAHLRDASLATLTNGVAPDKDATDGGAYRVTGEVVAAPETRQGGHVFFRLGDGEQDGDGDSSGDPADSIACAAFEPTKRFRDRVRALRVGDRLTVCGELSDGTLKLEKFCVRDLVTTERVTPTCSDCGRSMESAGRDQGYRCRDCGTSTASKEEVRIDRDLEPGWYEVPPVARRHIAKPLVRGGFDAPVHPER